VQKSKESTARISLYKELKTCPCIFTMESSFSGMDFGPHKGEHLTQIYLEKMGKDLCRSLLLYDEIAHLDEICQLYQEKPNLKEVGDYKKVLINELI